MEMDEKILALISSLRNPRYAEDSTVGSIEFDAVYDGQQVIFWASPIDLMEYGREIHRKALDGNYGEILAKGAIKGIMRIREEEAQERMSKNVAEHKIHQKASLIKMLKEVQAEEKELLKDLEEPHKENKDPFQ